MFNPNFKSQLLQRAKELLQQKINALNDQLAELTRGIENESKSSAGDKHETARAMVQLEQKNTTAQLNEFLVQLRELQRLNLHSNTEFVLPGSVVQTDHGIFFISIPLGKINVDSYDVVLISPSSPLGKLLIGKRKNTSIEISKRKYTVTEVL